jgi:hypothetical protein
VKSKKKIIQLTLITVGLSLFFLTYFLYPTSIRINDEQTIQSDANIKIEGIEKVDKKEQYTAFQNIEYNGFFNIDKPFIIKSEKAYILNEEPDIIYMNKMHVILNLGDNKIVNITSDNGIYNKITYDCFFENNVNASDESTHIKAENLDLISSSNAAEVYNNVFLNNEAGSLAADKINYNFETKKFAISMFSEKLVKVKLAE